MDTSYLIERKLIAAPSLPGESLDPSGATGAVSILVVDDADNWRNMLVRLLEGRGHIVHAAPTYEEAMAIVDNHAVDVAVVDIRLVDSDAHNQDGISLAHQLTALNPSTAIILLTGFDVPPEVENLKRRGVVLAVIEKHQSKVDFDAVLLRAVNGVGSAQLGSRSAGDAHRQLPVHEERIE